MPLRRPRSAEAQAATRDITAAVLKTMTALVQRLERQGLASRSADPKDGRVSLVATTDAGHELLAERHRAQRARVADLLAELPEQDVQALSEAMHTALPIVRCMLREATSPRTTRGGTAS
ncbi:MarR family winged helix-turn-helix transcriptional regulator [Kitasatospora sp. NPDC101155]|uniref:MarR family winged helix-turn-helix transcriptional regulator n=1 Tax=Kitasatospora sp. NPDC101155 TaxID=3364097 RepID=UPI00382684A4